MPAELISDPPTTEKGQVAAFGFMPVLSWSGFASLAGSATEDNPDLLFPQSAITYSRMRNDAQVNGLWRGTTMPITRYDWFIDPNGAADAVVEKIADDLGLPIGPPEDREERPRRRSKRRFAFGEHLRLALLAPFYGFYFFEQVMEYREGTGKVHLRKLAERPPWSISPDGIDVAEDGGLVRIRQPSNSPLSYEEKIIEIERLLCYVWEKEGANWTGRSLLRSCYGPWLVKDRTLRVGAINIERNGAGTPIIEAPPGADRTEIEWLDNMARRFRAGHSAGGAIPAGTKLTLKGVEGTQPDTTGFLKFLNEEMSRSFLMMFMQLGQTDTGSRALGGEFIDWFGLSQESLADWFCDTFNEHQIEDDVDWNEGPDEPAPLVDYVRDEGEDPTEDLRNEVEEGNVEVDEEVAEAVQARTSRRRRNSRRRLAGSGRNGGKRRRRSVSAAEPASPVPLPDRPLRREPYPHEVQAATNFLQLDSAWNSTLDLLEQESRTVIDRQISELHDDIVAADGNLDDIEEMAATPGHGDAIESRLRQMVSLAAAQAVQEAQSQGVTVDLPDVSELEASMRERAVVISRMIARDVSASATRRAIRLTGGSLSSAEVADQVAVELRGLTWAGVRDQLGGALTTAQNAGRGLVFRRDDRSGRIYASELLDVNTCERCRGVDGTEYEDVTAAERDYPTGMYYNCDGRERCRGTLVKVYDTETPPTLLVPGGA